MHHMSAMQNELGERPDGGPAYPVPLGSQHNQHACAVGMSLRDWFAGQAVVTLTGVNWDPEQMADVAYRIADAMLARRNRER